MNGERLKGKKIDPDKVEIMRKGWLKSRNTPEYKAKIAKAKLGTKNPVAILNDEKVIEIRAMYKVMLGEGNR